jgi:hypothetical protein
MAPATIVVLGKDTQSTDYRAPGGTYFSHCTHRRPYFLSVPSNTPQVLAVSVGPEVLQGIRASRGAQALCASAPSRPQSQPGNAGGSHIASETVHTGVDWIPEVGADKDHHVHYSIMRLRVNFIAFVLLRTCTAPVWLSVHAVVHFCVPHRGYGCSRAE